MVISNNTKKSVNMAPITLDGSPILSVQSKLTQNFAGNNNGTLSSQKLTQSHTFSASLDNKGTPILSTVNKNIQKEMEAFQRLAGFRLREL